MSTQPFGSGFPTGPAGTFVGPDDNPDLYELIRHIGIGGEAQVWRAKTRPDPASAAAITVAVKVFTASDSPASQAEWLRRTQAMAHVRNPGLAQTLSVFVGAPMHAAGERSGGLNVRCRYLVMEFVDGLSLQEWIEDHPDAGLRERFNLLSPIAAALDALHAGTDTIPPIAHGDIKPDNARITADGGVKLVDFGLMRMQGTTRGGPAMASIPYTAPEIFAAGPDAMPTVETDRFSFAATVFHMLTGQAPPIRPDGRGPDASLMRPILESSALTAGRPEISNAVIAALSADPRDRPTSLTRWLGGARATSSVPITAREGSQPTQQFATQAYPPQQEPTRQYPTQYPAPPPPSGYPAPPATGGPASAERPRRRRRGLLLVAAGAAVALGLGAGAYAVVARGVGGATAAGSSPSASVTTAAAPSITPTSPASDSAPAGASASEASPTALGPSNQSPTTDSAVGVTTPPVLTSSVPASLLLAGRDSQDNGVIALSSGVDRRTQSAINGRSFDTSFVDHCWGGTCGPASVDLNLGRSYSTFTARLGVLDYSELGKSTTIRVIGDGKLLLTRTVSLGVSYDVTTSVKNVLRLQIVFGSYAARLAPALGDPTVVP